MKLKKMLAIFLAAVLIFSALTVTVGAEPIEKIFEVGVTAKTTAPVSSSPVIYKSGEAVTVTISADQNTGFDYLKFKINYDPEALELVDYTSNKLFGTDGLETIAPKTDHVLFSTILNGVSTATGEIFTLNFKTKADFCGEIEISAQVSANNPNNCMITDPAKETVVPFVGGKVSFTTHAVDAGVVTAPNCGNEGYTSYTCAICEKNVVGNITPIIGEHVYDNDCDAECNICKQIRTVSDHVYDNDCDEECNVCKQTRTITHNYEWVIDTAENCGVAGIKHEECTVCHTKRNENTAITATGKHTYDNACDTECNVCKQTRTITHNYEWVIDTAENCGVAGIKHEECTVCHTKRNENTAITATGNHTYDNACDTECNVCKQTRTTTHDYKWIVDKAENCGDNGIKHEECTICHTKRNENTAITATGNHTYDNACDTECNVCKQTRTTTHDYKWIVDKAENCGDNGIKHEECTICHTKRNENTAITATGNHTYDNACDTECNVCKQTRTVPEHVYSHIADNTCNVCNSVREVTGVYLIEEDGQSYYYLDGVKQTEVTDLVKIDGTWYYIEEGRWASEVDTLHKINGKWFLVKGGIWKATTGLVEYKGKTFYVVGGKWESRNDLYKINGKWYLIQGGKWDSSIDSLHKLNGKWFLVKNGIWKATTGLVEYKGKQFYVVGGKWQSRTGIYTISGKKHYIKGGKWDNTITGTVTVNGKKYTVKKGIIK